METTKLEFDRFVLDNLPHFVAVNYQRLEDLWTPQERLSQILHIYNLGLRALTIGIVSQYLIRDRDRVCDSYLNDLLLQKFPKLTLDAWQNLLFAALLAYEGKEDLFFMRELYQFYWDTSVTPHRRRIEVQKPFERLTQIALSLDQSHLRPQDAAGWEHLAGEAEGLLHQVLESLAFLAKYDLVRVLSLDNGYYDFELHRGLTIVRDRQPIPDCRELNSGWFYLRRETADLLLLHPFLVSWEEEPPSAKLAFPADTAIYDHFFYDRLQYLLTSLNRRVPIEANLGQFFKILFDTIEEVKAQRREANRLTWANLQSISAEISELRMATVRGKYDARRYLQREGTREAFERFLHSDKRCFVLTGKSGVGKSNFFLALANELRQRNDLCLLMYDGAQIRVEPSITETISRDFDNRIRLPDHHIADIWREIAGIDGIHNRTVLLIVDAINENPRAKELLRQLDDLVQGPWPWLKVVFSSRPETWRTIKSGVKLAEMLYYRSQDGDSLGVELEHFSYSEQLEPFSKLELPQAYVKYRDVFGLQTPYEDLSSEIREMLADPFNLWLVAKTYRRTDKASGEIPDTLRDTELVQKYVEDLDILRSADRELLTNDLVPLFAREGKYRTALTLADIREAGELFFNAVYSEAQLSDGTRRNQAFENLVNADILTRRGQGASEEIAFKYERFYEYFVGKHIFELSEKHANPFEMYGGLIGLIKTEPFLWGAIKNALIAELQRDNTQLILSLAQLAEDPIVNGVLVAAIEAFGRRNQEGCFRFLSELRHVGPKTRRGLLGRPIGDEPPLSIQMARRTAVEAAYRLGMIQVIEGGARDSSSAVRAISNQLIWQLFRGEDRPVFCKASCKRVNRSHACAFCVLEGLGRDIVGPWKLPDLMLFESLVSISALVWFDHYQDREVMKQLEAIWRPLLQQFGLLGGEASDIRRLVGGAVRNVLSILASSAILRLFRRGEETEHWFNGPELAQFFSLSKSEKDAFGRLIPYFGSIEHPLSEAKDDILTLCRSRDVMSFYLLVAVFSYHTAQDAERMIPLIREMFDVISQITPSLPVLALPRDPYRFAIPTQRLVEHPEWLDSLKDMAWIVWNQHHGSFTTKLRTYEYALWETYFYLYYSFYEKLDVDTVNQILEKTEAANSRRLLWAFVKSVKAIVAYQSMPVPIALRALEPILNSKILGAQGLLIDGLALIRPFDPQSVDDFLFGSGLLQQLHARVKAETVEHLSYFVAHSGTAFAENALIMHPNQRRIHFVREIFYLALRSRSLSEWASRVVSFVLTDLGSLFTIE
jgi:hypothetical protein